MKCNWQKKEKKQRKQICKSSYLYYDKNLIRKKLYAIIITLKGEMCKLYERLQSCDGKPCIERLKNLLICLNSIQTN